MRGFLIFAAAVLIMWASGPDGSGGYALLMVSVYVATFFLRLAWALWTLDPYYLRQFEDEAAQRKRNREMLAFLSGNRREG